MVGALRTLSAARRRSGFTLIELMVVISVVLFLMTVLVVVMKTVIGNARAAATKGTIRKIDALLTKRAEALHRELMRQDKVAGLGQPLYVREFFTDNSQYAPIWNQGTDMQATARVLARKHFMKQYLPMRFNECRGGAPAPGSSHTAETENAETLYYMLTGLATFGAEEINEDAFSSSEVKDTDGDGLLEFVDGWGRPLRFYRWPTRLIRTAATAGSTADAQSIETISNTTPHDQWKYGIAIQPQFDTAGSGAQLSVLISAYPDRSGQTRGADTTLGAEHEDPLAKDPDDPRGLIHGIIISDRDTASQRAADFESLFHTPDTHHTPLIVSAGQDGALGLYEPNNTSQLGHLARPDASNYTALLDNITNRNVKAGGN